MNSPKPTTSTETTNKRQLTDGTDPTENGGGGGGGGGGRRCFPSGTKIATPNGYTNIEALCMGGKVRAFDFRTGKFSDGQILSIRRYPHQRIWIIKLQNDIVIRTTSSHSFYIDQRWVIAKDIAIGQQMTISTDHKNQTIQRVVAVESSESIEDVYSIVVSKTFAFVADNAIAHSFSRFRRVQVLYWQTRGLWKSAIKWFHDPMRNTNKAMALSRRADVT